MRIRLGTRKSNLAVIQTQLVAKMLKDHCPDLTIETIKIPTKGDEILHEVIKDVGSKGVLVKGTEQALLDGKTDLAIRSMRDMPGGVTPGPRFVDPPKGEDPRNVLITKDNKPLKKDGAYKIGTGSSRRALQLKRLCPNCQTVPIRGNIETRTGKIQSENLDGVVLAYAGLIRAGYQDRVQHIFSEGDLIPASCQRILALQVREDGREIQGLLKLLAHEETTLRHQMQRTLQKTLNGGCQSPMGISSRVDDQKVYLRAYFGNEGGSVFCQKDLEGPLEDGVQLAQDLAQALKGEAYD